MVRLSVDFARDAEGPSQTIRGRDGAGEHLAKARPGQGRSAPGLGNPLPQGREGVGPLGAALSRAQLNTTSPFLPWPIAARRQRQRYEVAVAAHLQVQRLAL